MFRKYQTGFTIIELMLAMSFVSVLLVSVAMLTIQISRQYTSGVTMKEINQAGAEISDDIRRTLAASTAAEIKFATKNDGKTFILCSGQYSYIANNPELVNGSGGVMINSAPQVPARLVKVRDPNGAYCNAPSIAPLPADISTELLAGDRSLVVRNFAISPTTAPTSGSLVDDYKAGRMIYTVSLAISTGASDEIEDGQCRPPSDVKSGEEYCAIDTFVVVARVGNAAE